MWVFNGISHHFIKSCFKQKRFYDVCWSRKVERSFLLALGLIVAALLCLGRERNRRKKVEIALLISLVVVFLHAIKRPRKHDC